MGRVFLVLVCLASLTSCASETTRLKGFADKRGKIKLVEPATQLGDFLVPRKIYDEWLRRGAAYFIRQVMVTPIVEDEQFIGFRLDSLFENHVLFSEGEILRGDIVQRINHQPIGRPDQFMKVWGGLKGGQSLVVDVLRAGQGLRLTWAIVGEPTPKEGQVGLRR